MRKRICEFCNKLVPDNIRIYIHRFRIKGYHVVLLCHDCHRYAHRVGVEEINQMINQIKLNRKNRQIEVVIFT